MEWYGVKDDNTQTWEKKVSWKKLESKKDRELEKGEGVKGVNGFQNHNQIQV